MSAIILSTTDFIPNRDMIEILGIARGNTVRSRNIGRDIFAGLKNIGADAVISIRMTTSVIMQGATEILVSGTAVKLK